MRRRAPALFEQLVGVRARVEDDEADASGDDDDDDDAGTMAERILNRERNRERRARARTMEGDADGAGGGGERFGSAFASSSATRALERENAGRKMSDEAWRRAMFAGWGRVREDDDEAPVERVAERGEESARAEAPTFIVDVDEYGSNRGDSTAFISQSEYVARVAEFERVMRERFLDGLDENFDYARVDDDPAQDAHWRREMDQDVEDAYFDAD